MQTTKVLSVALATMFVASMLQAAPFLKPAGKAGAEAGIELIKGKKSKAGSCGTYMYYKKGKCEDARLKK